MFFIMHPNENTQNTEIKHPTCQYDLHPLNNKAKIISSPIKQFHPNTLQTKTFNQNHISSLNTPLFKTVHYFYNRDNL